MSRRPDDLIVSCPISPAERQVIADMMAAGGVGSTPNLIRIALWSLADTMQVQMPDGCFDLRLWQRAPKGTIDRGADGREKSTKKTVLTTRRQHRR